MDKPVFATTEERVFKACPMAHMFEYELGYRPQLKNRMLSTGIVVHEGLAAYYKGEDAIAVTEAYADKWWDEIMEAGAAVSGYAEALLTYRKDRELAMGMVANYIEHVERERWDDAYTVVAVEEAFVVDIPEAASLLPVRIDLIMRDNASGTLIPFDHKTAKAFPKDWTQYQLSEQNGNYQLAILAKYGERPSAMVYNLLRKILPSGRSKPPYFERRLIRLSEEELRYRAAEYIAVSKLRFDPDRTIFAVPDSCCGSWKADWRGPCTMVHQGVDPEEALLAHKFVKRETYARYDDVLKEAK